MFPLYNGVFHAEAPQPHIPLSNQPVSSNNPHQAPEQHTVGTGHHGPFVMDSGQALQQLAVRQCKRSGMDYLTLGPRLEQKPFTLRRKLLYSLVSV